MTRTRRYILLFFLLAIAGCAAHVRSADKEILPKVSDKPSTGYAFVYLFREPAVADSKLCNYYIDQDYWGQLAPKSFLVAMVPAGRYELKFEMLNMAFWDYSNSVSVFLKAGETYYYRFGLNKEAGFTAPANEVYAVTAMDANEAIDKISQYTLSATNSLLETLDPLVANIASDHEATSPIQVLDSVEDDPKMSPTAYFYKKNEGSPRRIALVIGNSSYPTSPLSNPLKDAQDISASLRRLGFTVIQKDNASLRDMEMAMSKFYASLKQGGVGLFYYAGHGIQIEGRNYLVPVDANITSESDTKYECMDAGRILGKMEDAGNDMNIVILDACRNNPFARSFRSANQGLARMDAPTGSIVAYSTAPGKVASDGEGENGVYTKHLLRHMLTPGLSINDVFILTRMDVIQETDGQQVPWESSSLTGYFYFMKQHSKSN